MKLLRIFTLFIATSLLTTACMRADLHLSVDAEGNGTINGTVLYSEKLGALAAMEEDADFDFCAEMQIEAQSDGEMGLGLPGASEITPISEDGWCGVSFTSTFTDFDPSGVGDFDGGGFVVEGDIVSFSMDMTDMASEDDMEMEEFAMMMEMFDIPEPVFTVDVTLPGEILSHNADSVDGSTLHWDVDFFGGGKNLTASADMSVVEDDSNTKVIIIVVIVAALLAALVARQRSGSALTAPEESSEADESTNTAE